MKHIEGWFNFLIMSVQAKKKEPINGKRAMRKYYQEYSVPVMNMKQYLQLFMVRSNPVMNAEQYRQLFGIEKQKTKT